VTTIAIVVAAAFAAGAAGVPGAAITGGANFPMTAWPPSHSELTQSAGQRPHFSRFAPQPPTEGTRICGLATMLVIAVARALWPPPEPAGGLT
jgi:hypothetical protein